jgi:alkylhydroperoxidase family enzyme
MSTATMQSRMENPALAVPGALKALHALANSAKDQGVPPTTAQLAHLRASQINAWNRINATIHQVAMPFSG